MKKVSCLPLRPPAYLPAFDTRALCWSILDSYCIPTRYPNGLPDGIPADVFTRDAAGGAVRLASAAVELVQTLLLQAFTEGIHLLGHHSGRTRI